MNKLAEKLSAFVDGTESHSKLMTVLEDTFTSENSREILDLLDLFEKAVNSRNLPKQDYLTLVEELNELRGASDSETRLYLTDRKKWIIDVSDESISQLANKKLASHNKTVIGVGSVLNRRFTLDEVIGQGGMGVIYKARDIRKDEAQDKDPYVAIKVLSEDFQSHPDAIIALQRETKKAQKLAHPNIVTVYDFDRDGDTVFMTMEWLEGESLRDIIKHKSTVPHQEAISIIQGMVNGLTYAHNKGIIHLDLKPGNVFVTTNGVVKILDFGIAQAAKLPGQTTTEDTTFNPRLSLKALTPPYASCEIVEEEPPDPRDDIYALGCIAYELLVGRHPFNKTVSTVARDAGQKPKKAKELSTREWNAIVGALKFERAERTPTANQFIVDLVLGSTSEDNKNSLRVLAVAFIVILTVVTSFYFVTYVEDKADLAEKIDRLIVKAEQEFRAEKITEPEDKNALTTYNEILKLDPNNVNAKQGLEKIGNLFFENARQFAKDKNWETSLENIRRGREILPENEESALLLKTIHSKKEQFDRQVIEEKEISGLLTKANKAFKSGSSITQDFTSAYDYYSDVLRIDTKNTKAKAGINLIKNHYVEIVEQHILQENWEKGLEYLEPLFIRFPADKKITKLQEQVNLGKVKTQEIRQLLKRAEQQILAKKLSIPKKDNAFDTYTKLLEVDPENSAAKAGLKRIVNQYIRMANQAIRKGDYSKADMLAKSGLRIDSVNPELKAIKRKIEEKKLESIQIAKKRTESKKLEIERREGDLLVIKASKQANVEKKQAAEKQELIKQLLRKAEQHLEERRFASPPRQNAYETFKEVLERDPVNTRATIGIENILNIIVASARDHFENSNWEQCLSDIKEGLKVKPKSKDLLTLRDQVESKRDERQSMKRKRKIFGGW